jgi:hypothetical protein
MKFFKGLMIAVPIVSVMWGIGFAIAYGISKLF